MNNSLSSNVKYHVVQYVPSAPGLPQRKGVSPGVSDCHQAKSQLKSVKGGSCVTQLLFANPVSNAPNAVPNLPVGARLLGKLVESGCRPESSSDPKRGLHPPLLGPAKTHKVSDCHKLLCQSSEEQLPTGGITSAYRQKCSRTGHEQNISELFQQTFPSPKTKQQVAPYSRPQPSEPIFQDG